MPRTTRPVDSAKANATPKPTDDIKSNGSTNGSGDYALDREVAKRAYEIYQSEGGRHGFDLEHWLAAERELKAGQTSVEPPTDALPSVDAAAVTPPPAAKRRRTKKAPAAEA